MFYFFFLVLKLGNLASKILENSAKSCKKLDKFWKIVGNFEILDEIFELANNFNRVLWSLLFVEIFNFEI